MVRLFKPEEPWLEGGGYKNKNSIRKIWLKKLSETG